MAVLNYMVCGSFDAMRRVDWRLQAGIWGTVLLTLLSACVSGPWLHGVLALILVALIGIVIGILIRHLGNINRRLAL